MKLLSLLLSVCLLAVSASRVVGQENAAPKTAPTTAPATAPANEATVALLQRVREAYANLEGLRLEATVIADYDVAGRREHHETAFTDQLDGKGRFLHTVPEELTVHGDAEAYTLYAPGSQRYYRFPREDDAVTVATLPGPVVAALVDHDPSLLLALVDDATAVIGLLGEPERSGDAELTLARPEGARYVLRFDPQTWLLREVTIDEAPLLEAAGVPAVRSAVRRIAYETVEPNAVVAEDALAWQPPAAAQEIEPTPLPATGQLAGQPAPDLALPDLAGNVVSLEALRGRVVVVDFWATWCGPCVVGMPHLKRLAEQHGDEGLTVLAVNLRESQETITGFIAEHGLTADNLQVLRDADGSAGRAWGVEGIPMTAVIGRDGIVQEVVVGLAPQRVEAAVEAALEGE